MSSNIKGSLWMLGGVFALASMAIAGKEISLQIDTFEIMFFRSCIGFTIVSFTLFKRNELKKIKLTFFKTHLKRNLAHFTGQNLWFYSLATITLAEVTALEFTMPIWIMFFSYLMLNEELTKYKIISAVIGFIGVLVLVRPEIQNFSFGLLAASLAAIAFALTNIYTRKLTKSETTLTILFFLTIIQMVFGLLTSLIDGSLDLPSSENILWIVVIGFAGVTAHFCITTALSFASPTVVAPIDLLRLPLVVAVGIVFYSEPSDLLILIGTLIILYANWLNITKTK